MFNPDEPREAKRLKSQPPPVAPHPVVVRAMEPEESFRRTLLQSSLALNGHGIGFRHREPVIIDQAKYDGVTGWRKDVVNSVWNELREAHAKKRGGNLAPLP